MAAVAASELGARVACDPVPLAVNEVIHSDRAARGHFISFLYRCRLITPLDERRRHREGTAPIAGAWAWHNGSPADLMAVQNMYRPFIDNRANGQ